MPIEITMPRLSDTMETGTIIKWNVKEGDSVSAGDVIADVETDKATMEMAAFDDGTIAKIAVPEGKPVSIGTVIAVLAAEGENVKDIPTKSDQANGKRESTAKPKAEKKPQKPEEADAAGERESRMAAKVESKPATQPAHAEPPSKRAVASDDGEKDDRQVEADDAPRDNSGRLRVSPVARHLAEEHGIDVRTIEGTGPGGRIIKRDVLKAIEAAEETAASVAPAAQRDQRTEISVRRKETEGVPVTRVSQAARPVAVGVPGAMESHSIQLSSMRQTIAKRLVESKSTIPHYQVTVTFNMDPLLDMRRQLNQQLDEQGVKLSINDFLVRCCALAMYRHPEFNASWGGDRINIHGDINIGIAISIPIERGGGLVVATIRNADQKSLRVISFESKMLAEKARTRGLSVEDMSDSTFTISNLGMFGVDNFTAIINPPNSAIMAVGAAIEKPVVRDHQLTVGHEMSATLSCDHRVIDGSMAAQYLQTLKHFIENPGTLLV